MLDRRSRRSAEPELAARYLLLELTRKHRAFALVVADEDGRILAAVEGRRSDAGFVASRADEALSRAVAGLALPELLKPAPRPRFAALTGWLRRTRPAVAAPIELPEHRFAARVEVSGRRLVVVAVGERPMEECGQAAASGVSRIFRT